MYSLEAAFRVNPTFHRPVEGMLASIFFGHREPREVPHAIHVELVRLAVHRTFFLVQFVAIVDVPNQHGQVNGKDDESGHKHGDAHAFRGLRCRMAMEKRRMVPAQCAEYKASSVWPKRPKLTE